MKNMFLFIIIMLLSSSCFPQTNINNYDRSNSPKWYFATRDSGTVMRLTFPEDGTYNSVFITIFKQKNKPRPDYIAIAVYSNYRQSDGLSLKFATDNLGTDSIHLNILKPGKEYYRILLEDGYAVNGKTKERIDILQRLLGYKHVYVIRESFPTIDIPLSSFRESYSFL